MILLNGITIWCDESNFEGTVHMAIHFQMTKQGMMDLLMRFMMLTGIILPMTNANVFLEMNLT